ncbi:MAG: SusC/RagA family TonB-linked outer membrane protein, partial [Chloroflexota bacterium]
ASEYMMLMNEGARNAGMEEKFDLNEIPKYDTDWQEELFEKNAPIESHEISVMGGAGKSTYFSSLAFFNQEGIIGGDKSHYQRISARFNSDHQVNKRIHFGNTLSYTHIFARGIGSNESFNGALSSALNLDPLTPVFETDPEILAQRPYSDYPVVTDANGNIYGISTLVNAEIVNPLALLEIQHAKSITDKLVGTIFGDWEIIDGLKFGTNLSLDLAYNVSDGYDPLFYLNSAQNNTEKTRVRKTINHWATWKWENTLSYTKKINEHKFSIMAGTSASKFNYENLYGFNVDVPIIDPDNVYLNMALGDEWEAKGGASHAAWASTFGRLTYDFKEKYAFTAIVRRDGSSRFGPNYKYGVFPSVGFSWVASDESFFPVVSWLNTLKFRTSWGINGNDKIGEYQFLSTIDKSRGYIIGGTRLNGASPSYFENADLHWEQSKQIDIALDMELFNNRLVATADYYIKDTKDLLEIVAIPAHVGNAASYANVGSVKNSGVELSVNWRTVIKDFKYSVGVNTAYNKNEMIEIANSEGVLPGAGFAVAGMVTRTEEGLPIGYFYGYKTDGIFQDQNDVYRHTDSEGNYLQPNAKPGDVRFVDVNGDGIISPLDRTYIGSPHPDWTLGFNVNASYKQFDFSMFWYGTYGNEIFNGSQRPDLKYLNLTTDALNRWTGPGTSNEVPRFTLADNNFNSRISDLYIEDGSYLRLKNIQLGYTFSKRLLDRVGADTFRIYFSAENLLTLTNYTGMDPEIGARGSFDIGIDRGIYPQSKTFRIGTTITF